MKFNFATVLIKVCLVYLLITSGCERVTSPANENNSPETYLTNVPAESDTLFPLVTLYWNGGDNDGYIAKYEYRYITYLSSNDSIVQPWKAVDGTTVTITFISSEKFNKQKFQVRAVDNLGMVDPIPAEKIFYTRATIPPVTTINAPLDNEEFFVLDKVTDWWRGITLSFGASDKDGEIVQYSYSIDDGEWITTEDTLIIINPDSFSKPLSGSHKISVKAKDNTDLTDEVPAEVNVKLVSPTFEKTLLILDETNENNWPSGIKATDNEVDQFYSDLFGNTQWSEWDYQKMGGPPSREELGKYKFLLWHGDDRPTTRAHELANNEKLFRDYANIGGSFILSGWRMIKSFAWLETFPKTFEPESFVNKYLHITDANETPLGADFTHGIGVPPFNDVRVDTAKLNGVFPFFGTLSQVNVIPGRGAFTDIILSYGTKDNTKFPQFRGLPCGLIYYGTSFNAVVLGFPLFFMVKDDAKVLASKIMSTLNIQ